MIENLSAMIDKTVVEYEAAAKPARDKAARIAKLQKNAAKLKELFINDHKRACKGTRDQQQGAGKALRNPDPDR